MMKGKLLLMLVFIMFFFSGCKYYDSDYYNANEVYYVGLILHNLNGSSDTSINFTRNDAVVHNQTYDFLDYATDDLFLQIDWLYPGQNYIEDSEGIMLDYAPFSRTLYFINNLPGNSFYDDKNWSYISQVELTDLGGIEMTSFDEFNGVIPNSNESLGFFSNIYLFPELTFDLENFTISGCLMKSVSSNACYSSDYYSDSLLSSRVGYLNSSVDVGSLSFEGDEVLFSNLSNSNVSFLGLSYGTNGDGLWNEINVSHRINNLSLVPKILPSIEFVNYSKTFGNSSFNISFRVLNDSNLSNVNVSLGMCSLSLDCYTNNSFNVSSTGSLYWVEVSNFSNFDYLDLSIDLDYDFGISTFNVSSFMLTKIDLDIDFTQTSELNVGDYIQYKYDKNLTLTKNNLEISSVGIDSGDFNYNMNLNGEKVISDSYSVVPLDFSGDFINLTYGFLGTGVYSSMSEKVLIFNITRVQNDTAILYSNYYLDSNDSVVLDFEVMNVGNNSVYNMILNSSIYSNISNVSLEVYNKTNLSYKFKPSNYGSISEKFKLYAKGESENYNSDNYRYIDIDYESNLKLSLIMGENDLNYYRFQTTGITKQFDLSVYNSGDLFTENVTINVFEATKSFGERRLVKSFEFDRINSSSFDFFSFNFTPLKSGSTVLEFEILDLKSKNLVKKYYLYLYTFSSSPLVRGYVSLSGNEFYQGVSSINNLVFSNYGLANASNILYELSYLNLSSRSYVVLNNGNISSLRGVPSSDIDGYYDPGIEEVSFGLTPNFIGKSIFKLKYFYDNNLETYYRNFYVKTNSSVDLGIDIFNIEPDNNYNYNNLSNLYEVGMKIRNYGFSQNSSGVVGVYVKYEDSLSYTLVGTDTYSIKDSYFGNFDYSYVRFVPTQSGLAEVRVALLNYTDNYLQNNFDTENTVFKVGGIDLSLNLNRSEVLMPKGRKSYIFDGFKVKNDGLDEVKFNASLVLFGNSSKRLLELNDTSHLGYNVSGDVFNISLNVSGNSDVMFIDVISNLGNFTFNQSYIDDSVNFVKFLDYFILVFKNSNTYSVNILQIFDESNLVGLNLDSESEIDLPFKLDVINETGSYSFFSYLDGFNYSSDVSRIDDYHEGILKVVLDKSFLDVNLDINSGLFENYIFNSFTKGSLLNIYGDVENIGFDTINNTVLDFYFAKGRFDQYLYNPILDSYYLKSNDNILNVSDGFNVYNLTSGGNLTLDYNSSYGDLFRLNFTFENMSYLYILGNVSDEGRYFQGIIADTLLVEFNNEKLSVRDIQFIGNVSVSNLDQYELSSVGLDSQFNESGIYEVMVFSNESYSFDNEVEYNSSVKLMFDSYDVCIYSGKPLDVNKNFVVDACELDIDGDGVYDYLERNVSGNVVGNKQIVSKFRNLKLKVASLLDVYNKSFNSTETVSLLDDNTNVSLLEFDFDFNSSSLDLLNLSLVVETSFEGRSYGVVSGIDIGNQTKTLRFEKVSNTDEVCIKDAEISDVSEISSDCSGLNEYLLNCNGSVASSGHSCLVSNGYFVVTGLSHSGVIEFVNETVNDSGSGSNDNSESNTDTEPTTDSEVISTIPIITTQVVVKKRFLSPSTELSDSYDFLIDGYSAIGKRFGGVQNVVLKDKDSKIDRVTFDFNFSSVDLDLDGLEIDVDKLSDRSYVIVKNMPTGVKKNVRVSNLAGLNGVCVKDAVVNSISEVSLECNGLDETLVLCDGSLVASKYTCLLEGDYFVVTGLSHSAVIEANATVESTNLDLTVIDDTLDIVNADSNSTGNESEVNLLDSSDISGRDSKLTLYLLLGILILLVGGVGFYLISSHVGRDNGVGNGGERMRLWGRGKKIGGESEIVMSDVDDKNGKAILDYYERYNDQYSKKQLKETLVNNGYDSEEVDRIIK